MTDLTDLEIWIPCDDWEDLPIGSWLVCVDNERKPYSIADVNSNNIIVVGGHFHWDMKPLLAYCQYNKYEPHKE